MEGATDETRTEQVARDWTLEGQNGMVSRLSIEDSANQSMLLLSKEEVSV